MITTVLCFFNSNESKEKVVARDWKTTDFRGFFLLGFFRILFNCSLRRISELGLKIDGEKRIN